MSTPEARRILTLLFAWPWSEVDGHASRAVSAPPPKSRTGTHPHLAPLGLDLAPQNLGKVFYQLFYVGKLGSHTCRRPQYRERLQRQCQLWSSCRAFGLGFWLDKP